MKTTSLLKLLLAAVMAVSLTGCIVIPAWDVDHWDHHHGGHHYNHPGGHDD